MTSPKVRFGVGSCSWYLVGSGARCHRAPLLSGGDCLGGLRLGRTADARRIIARILFVRVVGAAQAELAARVLPCLTLTIPMETKLRQLLPNLGGGRFLECHPNPLADYLGQTVNVRRTGQQKVQHLRCGQCAVFLPRFRVNRQAIVRLVRAGLAYCCAGATAPAASGVFVLLNCADLLLSPI